MGARQLLAVHIDDGHPESLYSSVGNQLLKAGVRGVVAMSYLVYVQTAVRFVARLYQGLVNGEELSRAVTWAREELRAHPGRSSPVGEVSLRDWVVPVLFQAAPARLMPAAPERPLVQLSPELLQEDLAQAGTEIGCPEPPLYGFTGGDSTILKLEQAFQRETIVLLQGMAGVGKTETAVGFARWLAQTGALGGPIFFFSFEQHLPLSQVCDQVGMAFNALISKSLNTEWRLLQPKQRREVALKLLRQVPCLLIWDNIGPVAGFPKGAGSAWQPEELEELRAFLSALRGGASRVLLTSRRDERWLGKIYQVIELGGLKLVEAQELADKVLGRAGINAAQTRALPQYNDLLRYLGGNPLAIQVILPELERRLPEELLKALKSGAISLGEDDPAQGRSHSLRASLSYRLDAIEPQLRQRMSVLALFQGFVDANVLASICQVDGAPPDLVGLERDAWLPILDSAAEVGLLRNAGAGYYITHPALPWFFREPLQGAFPEHVDWLQRAFVAVYGKIADHLSQLFYKKAELAIHLLKAEENNLRQALLLARSCTDWESVQGILYGLNPLITLQGRWAEWADILDHLQKDTTLAVGTPLAGCESLWASIQGYRAEQALYQSDLTKANEIYNRLLKQFQQEGDEPNQATVLHQLGLIAQERRKFSDAEVWYRRSLEIRERIGNERGMASTLHQLGIIAQDRRKFEEAEGWYRPSLEIAERIGDERGQASTLHQLGMIAQERRRFDEAEGQYRHSLEIEERIGDERDQASTLHQLGMVAQERRKLDEAEDWYRRSLEIAERIGDEQDQACTLHQLGMIAQERGRFGEAEGWYRRSLEIEERIGDERRQASTLHQLGTIAQEYRKFDEARDRYQKSLEIKKRIGHERGQAATLHQMGAIAEEQGNIPEAERLYNQAEAIFARIADPYNLSIAQQSLKRIKGNRI